MTTVRKSVIQQPPLDDSKAAVLVIFQEHSSYEDKGNGVWADTSGRIWVGDIENTPSTCIP